MIWNPSEQHDLSEVIARIEKYRGLRCASLPKGTLRLRLSDAEKLKAELAYQKGGALLVRHLFKALNFDEGRLFAFRFDHKLVQAHILQHYCPGVVPITVGAMRELCGLTFIAAEKKVNDAYDDGFFIKAGLGDSSGETFSADRRSEIISILCNGLAAADGCSPWDEQFIFQKKVAISEEYRVHSLENTIIPDLTYSRYSPGATNRNAVKTPNLFVQNILNELPNGLIRDSLYGWDIAIDRQGNPIVIEVNSTGLHPIFTPGFQCSGFFLTPAYSISCLTRLLAAVSQIYGVAIDIKAPNHIEDQFALTYRLVGIYESFLSSIASVQTLLAPNQQFNTYPENVSNNLSFEENTLLWALAEAHGVESKVRGIDRRRLTIDTKSSECKLVEDEVDLTHEKPHHIPDEYSHAQLLVQPNTYLPPLHFFSTMTPSQPEVSQQEHKNFFQQMLGDMDEPTAPFGLLESEVDSELIEEAQVELEAILVRRIREAARRLDVDVETLFHLAFARVLVRVSGRTDVVFGTTLYGRLQGGTNPRLGLFGNILPLRIRGENESVEAGVVRTHKLLADLKRHERASLSFAHRCSAIATHTQTLAALLNYRRNPDGTDETSRASEKIHSLYAEESAIYPLVLSVDDRGERITLVARVQTPIGPIRICDFIRTALTSLAETLESSPTASIHHLETLPPLERNRVLYEWNDTEVEYSSDKCIHELFEEQVAKTPDAVAVVFEDEELSYEELNRRANRLAHHLRELGVGPDDRVAICVERGFEMIVVLLAVLKGGGAYVPLDPTYPADRLRFMLEDSAPVVLLTQEYLRGLFEDLTEGLLILDIDAATLRLQDQPETNINRKPTGLTVENLAYVIYTSGSTGVPKGVQIAHSSLTNLIRSMQEELHVGIDDVFLALTTISFDIAALELFLPLTLGARVKIVRRNVSMNSSRLINEIQNETTMVQATPTTWKMLIEAGWQGKAGLKVLCGGEAVSIDLAGKLVSRCTSMWNMYGPTETTIWSLVQKLDAAPDQVAIGRPIANTQVYILDGHGIPVPVGVAGELYIGGAGVARGYLNRPELTAEKFLAAPFSSKPGARMYRTGDLGRWLPDGNIEFLGRNDFQVKIRGFRIELGEIEARLAEHPDVRDAVVVAREDDGGDKRLVAYYTAANIEASDSIGAESLRSHLSAALPEYMVPAAYVHLDVLPLTSNGKLDRKALPAPEERGRKTPEILLTATECVLLTLWNDLFDVQDVQLDDTFLSLGGHSILAIRLINQLRSHFSIELSVEWIFSENACTRELACLIDSVERE